MGFWKWLLHNDEWELEQYCKMYSPKKQTEYDKLSTEFELKRRELALEYERRQAEFLLERTKRELDRHEVDTT